MGRITEWLDRNQQRILWLVFFISMGYYAAGFWGAVSQILLFGFIISLSDVVPYIRKVWNHFIGGGDMIKAKAVDDRRLVFVRIQEPHALLLKLRIGGQMSTMTWQDVDCVRYETYPEEALERALVEYKGKRISHYVEQNPDVEIDDPLQEIGEEAWIEVVPERDFSQEEE